MAKLFGELLLWLVRVVVADLIGQTVMKAFAWLDMKIPGRWPRLIFGGLLGIVAYFLIPILIGILGL
jgi:hypothetical protein